MTSKGLTLRLDNSCLIVALLANVPCSEPIKLSKPSIDHVATIEPVCLPKAYTDDRFVSRSTALPIAKTYVLYFCSGFD